MSKATSLSRFSNSCTSFSFTDRLSASSSAAEMVSRWSFIFSRSSVKSHSKLAWFPMAEPSVSFAILTKPDVSKPATASAPWLQSSESFSGSRLVWNDVRRRPAKYVASGCWGQELRMLGNGDALRSFCIYGLWC